MEYGLSGLISIVTAAVSAILLAVAGGIMLSRDKGHARLGLWAGRIAAILICVSPVLWARGATISWWARDIALGICGLVAAGLYWGFGLWYDRVVKPVDFES